MLTTRSEKTDIKSLDLEMLGAFLESIGIPSTKALRIYQALWQKNIRRFSEIDTISKVDQQTLELNAEIPFLKSAGVFPSADGTKKFLWHIPQGGVVESVLIPDENRTGGYSDRMTLCVSSQWGCAMKCSFCLTGDLGLKSHLTAGQILSQIQQVSETLPENKRITSIVMMGMGEPLHNYDQLIVALKTMNHNFALRLSNRKITVSTVGLVPGLKKMAAELPVNIAISLNASTEEQRRHVMPITKKYSLDTLLNACREISRLPNQKGRKITFEYVMMKGFNDSLEDAARLPTLLQDIPAKINLIPYNENPDRNIRRPAFEQVKAFQTYLVSRGWYCSIRTTRGIDISAACGQLGKALQQTSQQVSQHTSNSPF